MFNQIVAGRSPPRHLSSDHDPLFRFHRWLANLRILEVEEIKSIPYVPVSHPFVERLIGTIRREFLDHVLIWNEIDLGRKLEEFRIYYNENRVHTSRSVAALQENDLASRRPPMPSLITTLGGTIAAVCSKCQSQRNYDFATHRGLCFSAPLSRNPKKRGPFQLASVIQLRQAAIRHPVPGKAVVAGTLSISSS
jgi:hypothetical protein